MMRLLRFNTQEVSQLVEHCQHCNEHRQLYNFEQGLPGELSGGRPGASLWLVKDQGIYIMSSGLPRLHVNGEHFIANCIDCDPAVHDDWYERGRLLMGGDDLVEPIPLKDAALWLQAAQKACRDVLVIEWRDDSYALLIHRTPAPGTGQ